MNVAIHELNFYMHCYKVHERSLKCNIYQHVDFPKLGPGEASRGARALLRCLAQPALAIESRRARREGAIDAGPNLRRHAAAAHLNDAATFRPAVVGNGADARVRRARARSRARPWAPLRRRAFGSASAATREPRALPKDPPKDSLAPSLPLEHRPSDLTKTLGHATLPPQ